MSDRPDTGTRILVASTALIVILSAVLGANGIWSGEPFPVTP